jgi:hypothetical protein
MSRESKVSCIIGFLLSLSLQSLVLASGRNLGRAPQNQRDTWSRPEQGIRLTVLVHDYAHLPGQILTEAKDRANLIFRQAGVDVEWADCPLNDNEESLYPGCPQVLDATVLFLRIFPATAAKRNRSGEAFVAARIANIFWNRVQERAQRLNVSAPRFLAHTLAHELGHLLLGSNSHSATGIMTAHWDARAMTRICQEGLYFNSHQSEVMRAGIRRRGGQSIALQALLALQR